MRVLVADDDPVCRVLVDRLLKSWGYTTVVVCDGHAAARELFAPAPPDLAILDWMMPGTDGIEIARMVRSKLKERYVYLVLITAKDTQRDYLEALAAGADDLLTKPFDPQELKARLHVGQRILTLQAGLLQAVATSRFQATHDALTGLVNRATVLDTLTREISRSARECSPVSLIMIDIDAFKEINDTYGHVTGDEVLREVAQRLQSCVRTYDTVGRFGGEEFLAVIPNVDSAGAECVAERMRAALADSPVAVDGVGVKVTASFGVSAAVGSTSRSLHVADMALYAAKRSGRNRTCTWQSDRAPGEVPTDATPAARLALPPNISRQMCR